MSHEKERLFPSSVSFGGRERREDWREVKKRRGREDNFTRLPEASKFTVRGMEPVERNRK